jgi:myosin-5
MVDADTMEDKLWCPDKEQGWLLRRVKEYKEDTGMVVMWPLGSPTDKKKKKVGLDGKDIVDEFKISDTHPFDPSHKLDLDDIANMSNLHVAPLLDLLRRRYQKDQIYTCTADILISLNPYKDIEGLYDLPSKEVLAKRVSDALGGDSGERSEYERVEQEELKPHVYTLANQTYLTLLESGYNQSVLLSGESGAGKTEACKKIIHYLSEISHASHQPENPGEVLEGSKVEQVVVKSSPVMEAFGNAKTPFNVNSSRFGKFIRISYTSTGCMLGASTETFLLERSRLVSHGPKERTFHIFYQMCMGMDDEEASKLGFPRDWDDAGHWVYLKEKVCASH